MATVYPEISLTGTQGVTNQPTANPTFYFRSKSGLVTKVQAATKEEAKQMYEGIIIPNIQYPYCCCCWTLEECSQRYCSRVHVFFSNWSSKAENKEYLDILHLLLTRHPDCDILTRVKYMFRETPNVEFSDWKTIVENSDGTQTFYHPQTQTVFWRVANIRIKMLYVYTNKPFIPEAIELLIGKPVGSVCYDLLYENLCALTKTQIDRLAGSMEPTTEPPPNPELQPQPEAQNWSRRSGRLRRRLQGNTYNAIELSQIHLT